MRPSRWIQEEIWFANYPAYLQWIRGFTARVVSLCNKLLSDDGATKQRDPTNKRKTKRDQHHGDKCDNGPY